MIRTAFNNLFCNGNLLLSANWCFELVYGKLKLTLVTLNYRPKGTVVTCKPIA